MIKKFLKISILLLILLFIFVAYFAYFGIKTSKFNTIIKDQFKKQNINLNIDLKEVKLLLDLKSFSIKIKTINPIIKFNDSDRIQLKEISSNILISAYLNKKFAFENAAYFDVIHSISNKLSLRYGLRINQFIRLSQTGLKTYLNDSPVIYDPVLEIYNGAEPLTNNFTSENNVFKTFNNLEPRFNLSFNRNNDSFKFSYNRLNQYIHLISNTNSPQPLDIWTPSGPYIDPQKLDQFAVGYYKNIKEFKLESEIFYKKIKNRLDYIDGADLVANNDIERTLLKGKARAYGLELLLKKNKGRNQFWISYTLSKSEQKTPGLNNIGPGINNGEWYLSPYDKTHDISINSKFKINEKLTLNTNFIYQTGQPTNYPNAQYQYMNLSIPNYGLRNSNRLPNYHRLDLSLNLLPKKNKSRKLKSEWVFGIYNLYNRDNASSILFRKNDETLRNEAVQISIFGIVPSVTYNFNF